MKDKGTRGASCVPPAPHFPVPCTSRSAPRTPGHPLHFPAGSSALGQVRQRQQKAVDAGQCSVELPAAPSKGAPRPPGPEVPDCQMSPHPSLTSTPEPGLRHLGTPYPASAAPGATHCSRPSPPVLVDYPYRSTPNTVHPGPGSGWGNRVQLPGTEAASFLATWGSAWQERAWKQPEPGPGAQRPFLAGRQPSLRFCTGHPQQPQGLHTRVPPAAALRPQGSGGLRSTGHSVARGPRRPQDLCRLHLVERSAKGLTSWMDTTSGTPPAPGRRPPKELGTQPFEV